MRVVNRADVGFLQEAVPEELLVIRLRDPNRFQEHRGDAADHTVGSHPLAPEDFDRHLRRHCRLDLYRLVDGASLPAGEDMLDAENGRVLSRQRNIFEPQFLEHRDNRARDTVVGGKYAVDLVAVKGEHPLEDRRGHLRIPVGPLVAVFRFLKPASLVERVEDRIVAHLKQYRVVVAFGAVQLGVVE